MKKILIALCILSIITFSVALIIFLNKRNEINDIKITKTHEYSTSNQKSITDISSFIGKDYLIDDQHSYVGFKIKYFGFSPVRGRFNEFDGTIFYDKNHLESFSIYAVINVNSLNTGNADRDSDLINGNDWFNAQKYTYIIFRSTKVTKSKSGGFLLHGIIEIKGIKKRIEIKFDKPTEISRDYAKNEQVDYKGSLIIKRNDFNVKGDGFWNSIMENGVMQLSNEVEIELEIHSRRADYLERLKEYDSLNVRKRILDTILAKGIDKGIQNIDTLFRESKISAGVLSTIGKTLNALEKYNYAKKVFERKKELFPDKLSTLHQLGVTELFLKNKKRAVENFKALLIKDSLNTVARAYLKLLNNQQL